MTGLFFAFLARIALLIFAGAGQRNQVDFCPAPFLLQKGNVLYD